MLCKVDESTKQLSFSRGPHCNDRQPVKPSPQRNGTIHATPCQHQKKEMSLAETGKLTWGSDVVRGDSIYQRRIPDTIRSLQSRSHKFILTAGLQNKFSKCSTCETNHVTTTWNRELTTKCVKIGKKWKYCSMLHNLKCLQQIASHQHRMVGRQNSRKCQEILAPGIIIYSIV